MALEKKQRFIIIGAVVGVIAVGIGTGSYLGRTQSGIEIQGAAGFNSLKQTDFDPSTSGKEVLTIKTETKKNCSSTPWVIAEKKGFFAAEGLNVEYTGELTTAQILPAILNGTNNVTTAHPNAFATYVKGGAKIKGVAVGGADPEPDLDPKFRHMKFYVSPKLGVNTYEELVELKKEGKITINGTVPSCTTFIATNAVDGLGFDRDQLQFVAFDSDTAAVQAVQQGNLDIVGVHPPFYKLANDSGLIEVFDTYDTGLGEAAGTTLYYFTEKFIEENPEAVQRFVRAIQAAQRWVNENEEESIQLTADYIGQAVNATHYYYNGDDIPDELIQPWLDDLEKVGTLKEDEYKVEDLVTRQFIN